MTELWAPQQPGPGCSFVEPVLGEQVTWAVTLGLWALAERRRGGNRGWSGEKWCGRTGSEETGRKGRQGGDCEGRMKRSPLPYRI